MLVYFSPNGNKRVGGVPNDSRAGRPGVCAGFVRAPCNTHDTFGHCFMTEDGGELDNKFIGNLGSNTKRASRLVRQGESDVENPSTFWTANPMNEWIGNVAAGCEANGFWIELLPFVKAPSSLMDTSIGMNPKTLPMTSFVDNVAHSNSRHGLSKYNQNRKIQETMRILS